jgi:hypothetical protein
MGTGYNGRYRAMPGEANVSDPQEAEQEGSRKKIREIA